MSPYKPQHGVRCAHCREPGADSACVRCRLLLCARCADGPPSCDDSLKRRFDIGRRQVMAVDATGRQLMVRGRWWWSKPQLLKRLGGEFVEPDDNLSPFALAFKETQAGGSGVAVRETSLCSCGEHISSLYRDETIGTDAVGGVRSAGQETVRGRVIEHFAYDCTKRQLVVSTGSIVHVYECDDEHRATRRQHSSRLDGRVVAMGVAAGTLGLLTREPSSVDDRPAHRLAIHFSRDAGGDIGGETRGVSIDAVPSLEFTSGAKPLVRSRLPSKRGSPRRLGDVHFRQPPLFAVAPGGRAAAALEDHHLLVVNANDGDVAILGGHGAPLSFVSFCQDSVASADKSGELRIRQPFGSVDRVQRASL